MKMSFALLFSGIAMTTIAKTDTLTMERIFDSPDLSGATLRSLKISPAGDRVTFLRGKDDDREQLDLWEYHVDAGELRLLVDSRVLLPDEGELSDEEKARRERQRIAGLKGIVEYHFSADGSALLFPLGGDLYHYDLGAQQAKRLTTTEAFETDPKFSPQGSKVAFVREQNLFVIDLASGKETQLTQDGGDTIKNGMAEFIAQEEMDRDSGYWWSEDESKIAFLRVDQTPVTIARRYEIYAEDFKVFDQRYPYAGSSNVRIRLGIATLGGDTQWVDLGNDEDIYIPRVTWTRDASILSYQWQARDQKTLKLVFFDLRDNRQRTILTETSSTWVNLHHDLHFLDNRSGFIWASERNGFKHLYLYSMDGTLIRQLTDGEWMVDALEGVNETDGALYFTATEASPLEKQLYEQSLDTERPGSVQRVTKQSGFHDIDMNQAGDIYIDTYSTRDQPPQVSLHHADGQRITWLVENRLDTSHPYSSYLATHQETDFATLEAEDGQPLYYRITKPLNFDPKRRYPVFVHVYGGPRAQMVTNSWSRRILIEQYMAQRGYVVFVLDNRGSSRRGTRFENALYRRMGSVEVADQLVGVNFLKTLAFVDPARIGIFGWSYGGYMTLMCLMQNPNAYAMGVSVAPVTDWALYDTHYTERYMDHPKANAEGYRTSAVFPYVAQLREPLKIIHGMADDNVLFSHSTKVYHALQNAGILFDVQAYPGAKHGISGVVSQTHVYATIAAYFDQHLKPAH